MLELYLIFAIFKIFLKNKSKDFSNIKMFFYMLDSNNFSD